jgi:hypothetical protein
VADGLELGDVDGVAFVDGVAPVDGLPVVDGLAVADDAADVVGEAAGTGGGE